MPKEYEGFLSQKEFDKVVDLSLHHLKELGFKVRNIVGGQITIDQGEEEDKHFYLDNLVRKVAQLDQNEWSEEIYSHFYKLQDRSEAYDFLYKDLEHASKYLKVLIKPNDLLPNSEEYVTTEHFPKTLTFLVLDFEDQFHYVRNDRASEWEQPTEKLFQIALSNLSLEEIDVKEYEYNEQFQVFALFSGDFASAFTIELEQNTPFAVSELGTLLVIPTKGTAFLHPISQSNVIDLVTTIYPTVEEFYNEDTGNINTEFYWFYNNQFQIFPRTQNDDGTITISLPSELSTLLN
ncbi:MAG: hypothetical protein KI790_16580 [Cyclobacteriaceae bacterium]|nr:hypothetical protein [Cyclobacteriaceae bacterium HetDA_MAG_MS6]